MAKRRSAKQATSRRDWALLGVSVVVFAAACVIALVSLTNAASRPSAPLAPSMTPAQAMTLEPAVLANLTQIAPISAELRLSLDALDAQVAACQAYGEARRGQMAQHSAWLRDPSAIPRDVLPAFGANPINRLIVGMATYTLAEWGAAGRPQPSCLYEIGQALNRLLLAVGEAPFEAFEG